MDRYESNIKKARICVQKALVALQNKNSKGKQYDMCSNPNSQDLDILLSVISQIEKIYYQK